jgi:dTMP kinase
MLYSFLMAGVKRGKLIVIDGNDGSGKTTQLSLLKSYLKKSKVAVRTFDFPQYETFHGKMVGRFLNGDLGRLNDISPYLATYPYALDRMAVAPQIKQALKEGYTVLCNRYVTSNMGHMSARFDSKNERKTYVDWDRLLEYNKLGIPKEDFVVYLFVPKQVTQKLMENKDRSGRKYLRGKQKDIMEEDSEAVKRTERSFKELTERFKWTKIECVDKKGNMLTREEIHSKIVYELLKRKLI